MKSYSASFKRKMVQRMCLPNGPSATALSKEVGVSQSSLSKWLRDAREEREARIASAIEVQREGEMSVKKRKRRGASSQTSVKKPGRSLRRASETWSSEEKLAAVLESASLDDEQLGAFLRRKGLHQAQLEQWRADALSGMKQGSKRREKQAREQRRIEALEKELRRKEAALAEAAALLVLKKKLAPLWEDEVESTAEASEP